MSSVYFYPGCVYRYSGRYINIYFQVGNNLNSSGKIFLIHFQIKKRCNIKKTSFFFICAFLFWKQIGNIEIIHKSKEMIISMLDLFLEKWLKVLQQFKMLLLSVREQPYGIHSEKSHRWCNHSRMNFSRK